MSAALRAALGLVLLLPSGASALQDPVVTPERLAGVLPQADRIEPREGNPPVYQGFRLDPTGGGEVLVGYAFLTSDLPPEEFGYNAPSEVLVGMDLEGTLTGVDVISYRESLRASLGDFLGPPTFQRQFSGKHITEGFHVGEDVDGVTGATITVVAMATGVRNAARRLTRAYLGGLESGDSPSYIGTIQVEELRDLSWEELFIRGLAQQILVQEQDSIQLALSLIYLREPAVGEVLLGPIRFREGLERLADRPEQDHLMMFGLSGTDAFLFQARSLSFVQGVDTLTAASDDFSLVGLLTEGMAQRQVRRAGLLAVDGRLDPTRPFEIVLDLSPEGSVSSTEYHITGEEPAPAPVAATTAVSAGPAAPTPPSQLDEATEPTATRVPTGEEPGQNVARDAPVTPSPDPAAELVQFLASDVQEESVLVKTLARTSWGRLGRLMALLGLTMWAFLSKSTKLRWVTLIATLFVLGFIDRSFLSVSHIIAGISVGPGVYLADFPLLLLLGFTLVTTLLWGRVFCGFLCPFGALQDILERIVPRGFRRDLPPAAHQRTLLLKYPILGLVLGPALLGGGFSLFQYFEPFGTVFYWSPSPILWVIAVAFVGVSAIVPRFYCRYACPLGAGLALASLLSPLRIRRVEQCDWCKVCEKQCPTGAIQGADIHFKECVRCNICEIQLVERAGACGHSMEEIRQRVYKLPMAGARAFDA